MAYKFFFILSIGLISNLLIDSAKSSHSTEEDTHLIEKSRKRKETEKSTHPQEKKRADLPKPTLSILKKIKRSKN